MVSAVSVRRAAQRSLLSLEINEDERLAVIEAAPPGVKRLGLKAIHAAVAHNPRLAARALGLGPAVFGRSTRPQEVDYLGEGYRSFVYLSGKDTVIKVDIDSMGKSIRQQRKIARQMQHEHEDLAAYVGPSVLPHEVEVLPNPIEQDSYAVQTVQPYRQVDYLKLNEIDPAMVPELSNRIREARQTCPEIVSELQAIVDGSRALYADKQLSTDIIGSDNIGVATASGNILITDSQPVTRRDQGVQYLMNSCFDNLEVALALV